MEAFVSRLNTKIIGRESSKLLFVFHIIELLTFQLVPHVRAGGGNVPGRDVDAAQEVVLAARSGRLCDLLEVSKPFIGENQAFIGKR